MKIRRPRRSHFAPISDVTAEAVVADRDYVSKVYGGSPAIVFQFTHMENMASIRTLIDEKRASLEMQRSIDIEIRDSYSRTKKQRSAKQIAAGKKWMARINDDGDKIHGYDDGECRVQGRIYTDSGSYAVE